MRGIAPIYYTGPVSLSLLLSVGAFTILAAATVVATPTELELAVLRQAKQLQCQHAAVPMLCAHNDSAPVFHMHMAKMGGREVVVRAPAYLGQKLCRWAPARPEYHVNLTGRAGKDWDNSTRFRRAVKEHGQELAAHPCFTSFEMSWSEAVENVFAPARLTPLVVTAVRDPFSWLLSQIEHDGVRGRHKGLDDLMKRGKLHEYMPSTMSGLYDLPWEIDGRARRREQAAVVVSPFEVGRRRLDGMIFGLLNEFDASLCVWAFQMGHNISSRPECDCRTKDANASAARPIVGKAPATYKVWLLQNASKEARQALTNLHYEVDTQLFVYASNLFLQRVRVVEAAAGFPLLCGASRGSVFWPSTSSLDRPY